jgi:ferritin-like metal-binding protein YciE
MSRAEQTIKQHLHDARASESALVRVLQSQILAAPSGSYRRGLESHLSETREHERRIERRLGEIDAGGDGLLGAVGAFESALGQLLALGKAPLDLLRGSGGEEMVLANAQDACETEAREIATYTAIERLARSLGDEQTAGLAASICELEQRMLDRLLREIPRLADAVVAAKVHGQDGYELSDTGAAEAIRDAGRVAGDTAGEVNKKARRAARSARKIPGVAQAEGQLKGAVAAEGDLAIAGYDDLTAQEILERLPGLSQIELARIDSYERRHQNRSTVLSRTATLRTQEPWPGYDELTVADVRRALGAGEEDLARGVLAYERSHKARSGVIEAAERERERASA